MIYVFVYKIKKSQNLSPDECMYLFLYMYNVYYTIYIIRIYTLDVVMSNNIYVAREREVKQNGYLFCNNFYPIKSVFSFLLFFLFFFFIFLCNMICVYRFFFLVVLFFLFYFLLFFFFYFHPGVQCFRRYKYITYFNSLMANYYKCCI